VSQGRRTSRPNRRERESGATAIEFVLWTPVLFLLMFGSVQFGLAMFARHVAVTAAQEGDRVGREEAYPYYTRGSTAWQGKAQSTAIDWVENIIGGLVSSKGVTAKATGQPGAANPEVRVEVSFSIVTAIPDWTFGVDAVSQGPVECFYGAGALENDCEGP